MLSTSKSIWGFNPRSIPGCQLWLDAADTATMDSTPTVTTWNDKSGQSNNVTGTATLSGSNMTFNGTNQAFSNLTYVFPYAAYSLFAVYSNTTAPAASAYMNVMYGSNGYPMLGVYDVNKNVSARSVVANTGALGAPTVVGWAARIVSAGDDAGYGIATDSSGNVFVTGIYGAAVTLYGTGDATSSALPLTTGTTPNIFVAKYTSAGVISWAARISAAAGAGAGGGATDLNGNVFVTGNYVGALTLYNQDGTTGATLAYPGGTGNDAFVAKYTSAGVVSWAARIVSTVNDAGNGIATDSSGNVFVTGYYNAALTLYNQNGTTGASLAYVGGSDVFVAKYTSAGVVSWAARIASTGSDVGTAIATDSSGNVFVTGYYSGAVTLYGTGDATTKTLAAAVAAGDAFVAKYTPAGVISWAAQIASTDVDSGYGIATDSSGNVLVTGWYAAALTLYNQDTTTGASLAYVGSSPNADCFIAKYTSAGAISWAARIASTGVDQGLGIATDSNGNVLVTGVCSSAAATLYGTGDATSKTLASAGNRRCFVAKYTSAGAISWVTQIDSSTGRAIATDSNGNVFVTGFYSVTVNLYNQDGTTGATLANPSGTTDCFVAKYNPNGYITNAPIPASSNVLVSATYTPSTFSPFINGGTCTTLAGTTLATTGIYVGGPSNYFNGSLSELLVYNNTLTAAQRQSVEGYLASKWRVKSNLPTTHPFYTIPPFNRYFNPTDIANCSLWLDAADNSSMNSTTTVTIWNDKSGSGNTMTGTATWTGSNMTFNGSTQAFSNTAYVFPISAYSLFAVYSNTTAPASTAYMNVVYGSNGYPMLGVYDVGKAVSARAVVANTGALGATVGWAARIVSAGNDQGLGIATDPSGNVFVTGYYTASVTLYNQDTTTGASLAFVGGQDVFVAKYTSAGVISWAARIAGTTTSTDGGTAIATDSSGNVFVTGYYSAALTLYGTGDATSATLTYSGTGADVFVAKYTSAGVISWAARIASAASDQGNGIATDSSGNVFVTGYYAAALTLYGTDATTKTLAFAGALDVFVAKYTSAGVISWAARIGGLGNDAGYAIATDSSGNVFVTGAYDTGTLTLYGTGDAISTTLAFVGGADCFVAKYTSAGEISWAARIAGTGSEIGQKIATDSSGNVFVTGWFNAATTLYNQYGSTGPSLTNPSSTYDGFVAKYTSAGEISWAARIASTLADQGLGIATDSIGNVFVTGYYQTAVTLYGTGDATSKTLTNAGGQDVFVAKYTSAGAISWAARIASAVNDQGLGIATDRSGNVFVTGYYGAAVTLYNQDGTTGASLAYVGGTDCFVAKYNPNGYITNAPTPASSNVLVSATYTPSTFSPFINGNTCTTLAGTTLATTGIYVGGPSNYFNGSLSELIVYSSTLTAPQRQRVEGYLVQKWRLSTQMVTGHLYKSIPPAAVLPVSPTIVSNCTLWLDGADNSSMNSTTTVTSWSDKSGVGYTMTGTATWSGSNMTFNGSTQAFSNLSYVFPYAAYSLFAVYSNTTAPASTAYMNVMYGSNGYPMLGVYDVGKAVSARSVVANTGALGATVGWAARIASTGNDVGQAIATDSSGNVFVTGYYGAALTLYGTDATTKTLAYAGTGGDCFVAKYTPAGVILWAARIASAGDDSGYAIATDSSGNVFVTGYYGAAVTLYNQDGTTGASLTNPSATQDVFVAKYTPAGVISWAARIAGTGTDTGTAIATDSSGNAFVTGYYVGAALTLYGTGDATSTTLALAGGYDVFVAKYTPAGVISWAARIASTGSEQGYGIATDSSGNVFVTGYYGAALTLYGTDATTKTLSNAGGQDVFVAKYTPAGVVSWAARIASTTTSSGQGNAIATDLSGNVLVTGYYGAALTLYNQDTTTGATLAFTGGYDAFVAKYTSAGAISWAARIAGTTTSTDGGTAIATDSSGNVFVTGYYSAALTLYGTGDATTKTLAFVGGQDAFVAKYTSAGAISWAARIASAGNDYGFGIATDSSGNVFVTGQYGAAVTLYNQDGTTGASLAIVGGSDVFVAKYNPNGYITNAPTPASSNVLVSATYTPSTFSPFINGGTCTTLAGTTLATTGIFVGGPTSYFNGSLSELLVFSRTLTTAERQQLEGYLAWKWNLVSKLPTTHPYYKFPPAVA